MRHAPLVALALLAVALVVGAAEPRPTAAAAPPRAAAHPVYFVPIGGFPQRDVAALAHYFARKLGLKTGVCRGPRCLRQRSTDSENNTSLKRS